MRIDRLTVRNFKGFESREFSFHPQFNLIVGENGSGKTSVLDALSIAMGAWLEEFHRTDIRRINPEEVFLRCCENEEEGPDNAKHIITHWENSFPCEVRVEGLVQEEELQWGYAKNSTAPDLEHINVHRLRDFAKNTLQNNTTLPLLAYYHTGRLESESREASADLRKESTSRQTGYLSCLTSRVFNSRLTQWFFRQSLIRSQTSQEPLIFTIVEKALNEFIEGANGISFDALMWELVIDIHDIKQPFSNLSDGQRSILAMAGDIARRAVTLNPHLGSKVLQETPGIVLIDELDLHLHPRWQRRVIEDLRRTFPNIQFICTTHSPFLIQSLRSSEELVMLNDQPVPEPYNLSVEEIAVRIQQINDGAETSARYREMKAVAREFLENLAKSDLPPEKKLEEFKQRLADATAPYADNPAFQAILEMERIAATGK